MLRVRLGTVTQPNASCASSGCRIPFGVTMHRTKEPLHVPARVPWIPGIGRRHGERIPPAERMQRVWGALMRQPTPPMGARTSTPCSA